MTRFALIPAFALLAACEGGFDVPDFRGGGSEPAMADPAMEVPAAPMVAKERLIAATEANGCVIDATTIVAIMQEAAIGNDELAGIVTELEAEGRVRPDGSDAVRVVSPNCTA